MMDADAEVISLSIYAISFLQRKLVNVFVSWESLQITAQKKDGVMKIKTGNKQNQIEQFIRI